MRVLLVGAVVLVSVAGCAGGGSEQEPAAPPPTSAPAADAWLDRVKPADAVSRVGMPGACPLPFAFDVAAGWTAAAGDGESRDGLAADCAVSSDAGRLRVWVGGEPGSTPRGALERFVQGEGTIAEPTYRESTVGQGTGVELTFARPDGGARGRAFAVATPLRTLVVSVEAGSAAAYERALPGYLLAKQSLTPIER
ncbi:lipoprotein [Actinokineospora sp. PR83]|uniref:lipoprotein n=1 Tax=Actinokineospora sp. PR83 TaxID=2884908 RepID=UPI0027E20D23|nr:lipoprotein [Actinokineospora sp. PR83]MCG8919461.1 lipoprotein [Actinokineospora sp. PR83]